MYTQPSLFVTNRPANMSVNSVRCSLYIWLNSHSCPQQGNGLLYMWMRSLSLCLCYACWLLSTSFFFSHLDIHTLHPIFLFLCPFCPCFIFLWQSLIFLFILYSFFKIQDLYCHVHNNYKEVVVENEIVKSQAPSNKQTIYKQKC